LLRRYHRFLTDVRLEDGRVVTAHCVNSGTMEGLVRPGAPAWLLPTPGAHKKLQWTWVMTEAQGLRVGTDTSLPNRLVRALLEARWLPRLGRYDTVRPEFVHAPGSRVDFRLEGAGLVHDLEVKNCHLVYPDGRAYFPDSVSLRATKHLQALAREVRRGLRASVLFVVQREDARALRPSGLHDPAFADAARRAHTAGVRMRALRARPDEEGLTVLDTLPVELSPYDTRAHVGWRAALKPWSGWERPAKRVDAD
jgi:sugar fermentation stimulation protein A